MDMENGTETRLYIKKRCNFMMLKILSAHDQEESNKPEEWI